MLSLKVMDDLEQGVLFCLFVSSLHPLRIVSGDIRQVSCTSEASPSAWKDTCGTRRRRRRDAVKASADQSWHSSPQRWYKTLKDTIQNVFKKMRFRLLFSQELLSETFQLLGAFYRTKINQTKYPVVPATGEADLHRAGPSTFVVMRLVLWNSRSLLCFRKENDLFSFRFDDCSTRDVTEVRRVA